MKPVSYTHLDVYKRQYDYYFQFTLTGYGKDMESNVPHKKEKMIPIFQELSKKIGMKKVIWRDVYKRQRI